MEYGNAIGGLIGTTMVLNVASKLNSPLKIKKRKKKKKKK